MGASRPGCSRTFRQFLLRGNLVELAVAVVVGAAFGALVTALVRDLVTPLIAAIGGQHDFSSLSFTIHHSRFRYGDFLNALISFLTVSVMLFFAVLRPLGALLARLRADTPAEATTRECPECLSAIPEAARRCAFCTAQVTPRGP